MGAKLPDLLRWGRGRPRWVRGSEGALAWQAWTNGDVDECERIARATDGSQREHLLFLTSYVRGNYGDALAHFTAIDSSHSGLAELDESVVQAWLHLGSLDEAAAFARKRLGKKALPPELSLQVAQPVEAKLDACTVIPFADHELSPYLVTIDASLDGHDLPVHLDTGGAFVVMGTERAAKLGIELTEGGRYYHGVTRSRWFFGTGKELRLGDAVFTNVPIEATPTLQGVQDVVVVGTNVLEHFLATVDSPRKRLVLSPRRDEDEAARHLAMLGDDRVVADFPFYLWGDHYMFTRGGFGRRRDLNYFIDTGLTYLVDGENGHPRQASLWATGERYRDWGVPRDTASADHFESSEPVCLGPLEQRNQLVARVPAKHTPWESLGGVRIDGLLCQAFLKHYCWTLDFERHRYTFRVPSS